MSFYRRHVFICENRRDAGKQCCAAGGECENPVGAMRRVLREYGAHGAGKTRVNRAGCFDRCAAGPVLVVYPDGVWYQYRTAADLREIAEAHIIGGKIVQRLRLNDDSAPPPKGDAGDAVNTTSP